MNKPLIHLAVALIALIAVGVGYAFWYGVVRDTREAVAALTIDAETKEAAAGQISEARSTLSSLAADEAFFGSYFVSTTTVVSFLESIEATGESLGARVEVASVTPGSPTRLSVAVRITGSFSAVMRTVGAIEHAPYDITVANLTVDTNAASEGAWTATATFSVGTGPATDAPASAPPLADDL